ncbi:uncharacterized protein PG986_004672 [Apiospora aurea]|uniref:Uncharacterized protein n=1 Tax=Apiospora aurea TaxID=335848 RepID=A0ABR1QN86_9PEZI
MAVDSCSQIWLMRKRRLMQIHVVWEEDPKSQKERTLVSAPEGNKANSRILEITQDDLVYYQPAPGSRWQHQQPPGCVPNHVSPACSVHISPTEHPRVLDLRRKRRIRWVDDAYWAFENIPSDPCLRTENATDKMQVSWADVARFLKPDNKPKDTAARGKDQSSSGAKQGRKSRGVPGLHIPDFTSHQSFTDYLESTAKKFIRKCTVLRNIALGNETAAEKDYHKLLKVVKKRKTQLFPLLDAMDLCASRVPTTFLARTAGPGRCCLPFCFPSSCLTVSWEYGNEDWMYYHSSRGRVLGFKGDGHFLRACLSSFAH